MDSSAASEPSLTQVLEEVCKGDPNAVGMCAAWYQFAHVLDDLVDRDKPVSPDEVGTLMLGVIEGLAGNPFFQANAAHLLPVMRLGALNWVESERLRQSEDVREKLSAEVYKSIYQEVFWLTAGLCGGVKHQLEMMRKHRRVDWE